MKNKILIGITLFSMFFGAGNLIFPPFLGAEAGTSGWLAFVGLTFSAVYFPILGVVAVTLSGGGSGTSHVLCGLHFRSLSGHWSLPRHSKDLRHFLFHGSTAISARGDAY